MTVDSVGHSDIDYRAKISFVSYDPWQRDVRLDLNKATSYYYVGTKSGLAKDGAPT